MVDSQTIHDVAIVGVPVLLILAGLFFNNKGLSDLRTEINSRFDKVDQRFERINDKFDAKFDALRGEMHDEFERFYMTPASTTPG
jgi:hypothetical protein